MKQQHIQVCLYCFACLAQGEKHIFVRLSGGLCHVGPFIGSSLTPPTIINSKLKQMLPLQKRKRMYAQQGKWIRGLCNHNKQKNTTKRNMKAILQALQWTIEEDDNKSAWYMTIKKQPMILFVHNEEQENEVVEFGVINSIKLSFKMIHPN